jgi:hypothetical protein
MRKLLLAPLRRLWRDGHTLQLGTDPRLATMLELANPAAVRVLDLLDGTRAESRVLIEAARLGVPDRDARAMLDALRSAGLVIAGNSMLPSGLAPAARERLVREAGALVLSQVARTQAAALARTAAPTHDAARTHDAASAHDAALARTAAPTHDAAPADPAGKPPHVVHRDQTPAAMLRRRAAAQVLVAGHGWLGVPIAAGLAASGIGYLDPAIDGWTEAADAALGGLLPSDVSRSRASAAADAVRRAAPDARVTTLRSGTATFVVRVGTRPPSALATRGVRRGDAPRLDVHLRDGVVVIGPLVTPDAVPCPRCLDLYRRDRDDAWPALAAQLATGRDSVDPCSLSTALAGTAWAMDEVLRFVDGRPVRTRGATVEVSGPGAARRRTWPPHAGCDCSRRRTRGLCRQKSDLPGRNDSDG